MTTVEVRGRVLGDAGGGSLPPVGVDVGSEGEGVTLREVIRQAVLAQLAAADTQGEGAPRARRLVAQQFRAGSGQGGAATGDAAPAADGSAPPSGAAEVERALDAFRSGLFAVFTSGHRLESLDEQVTFGQGDRITFLRITALVGG